MAIPCKEFVRAGARWWPEKDRDRPELLRDAMAVAREILDFRDKARPEWWALENPPGRLPRLFPELNEVPRYQFNPFDFGDPWGKPTMIWGTANRPAVRKKVKMTQAQKVRIHHVPPGPYRGWLRAITPPGFAKAFFEVNP